uniref:Uncharacterized protein n=1 Tax=Leersia perrieri TaxID=77586 RepID=A0A0D9X8P9_9ORYZ
MQKIRRKSHSDCHKEMVRHVDLTLSQRTISPHLCRELLSSVPGDTTLAPGVRGKTNGELRRGRMQRSDVEEVNHEQLLIGSPTSNLWKISWILSSETVRRPPFILAHGDAILREKFVPLNESAGCSRQKQIKGAILSHAGESIPGIFGVLLRLNRERE